MRKNVIALAMVALIVLVTATPALAGKSGFSLVGVITDKSANTVTVQVHSGNRLIKPYIGQELTVQVSASTRFQRWTPSGCVPATFDEVTVGGTANIRGTVTDPAFVATLVTVDVPLDYLDR